MLYPQNTPILHLQLHVCFFKRLRLWVPATGLTRLRRIWTEPSRREELQPRRTTREDTRHVSDRGVKKRMGPTAATVTGTFDAVVLTVA
jgi:hypothetical protein